MSDRERWNELMTRWAAGDPLTEAEERERLEGASLDPLGARELALFEDARARGQGVDELPRGLIDSVLSAVGARPRLALVGPGARPAETARAPKHWRHLSLLAAALSVAAVAVAAGVALFGTPKATEAVPVVASNSAPRLARSELVLASGDVTAPGDSRVGGRPLTSGDRVSTGDGRACIGIDPGIDVCLGTESAIFVESLSTSGIRIRVERGTALAALTHREEGQTFSLTASGVDVTARGTVFAVERRANDAIDVVVMEGAVDVAESRQAPARVSAHSRLALKRGSATSAPEAIGRGEEARFWALLAARELWAKPELGVLEVKAGEARLEVAVDREAPLTLPFRGFVPAGRRSVTLKSSAGDEVTTTVDVVAGETLSLDARELWSKRAMPEEPTSVPSAASLLARARQELASGNGRSALALYEKLRATHPQSPEARTVLVTIGKLELDLKQPARALKSFDAYLGAPGPLAPEALAGKIRALRALGKTSEERRAIETYLARYPDGFESPLLEQRLHVMQDR